MADTRVSDIMTADMTTVSKDETLESAAKLMAADDVGSLPVCGANEKLVGIVTDRDIVVSAVARGKNPATTTVGEISSGKVVSVGPDDTLERAADLMAANRVRRLPVVEDDQLVGIVSQGDIARTLEPNKTGKMVSDISE